MLYIAYVPDRDGAAGKRSEHYERHIADLDAAASMSVSVKLAGPLLGPDEATPAGSFFLLEAPDIKTARAFVESNVFAIAGVWERPVVRAFRRGRGVALE